MTTAVQPTATYDAYDALDHIGRRVAVETVDGTREGTLVAVTRAAPRRGMMLVLRQNGESFDDTVPVRDVTAIRRTAGRPASPRIKAPRHLTPSNRRTAR